MNYQVMIKNIMRLVRALVDEVLSDVHTSTPAQVVSYDASTNTVSIKPCIKRIRTNDPTADNVDFPQIDDVPVKQFGSGKLLATVAPKEDSYGVMHFSERGIQNWLNDGGLVLPNTARKFAKDDGFFEPGIYPLVVDGDNGKIEQAIETDRIEFRTRTRTGYLGVTESNNVEMDGTAIKIGPSGEKTLLAETFKTAYDAHTHPTGMGPSGPPAVPLTALSTKVTNE